MDAFDQYLYNELTKQHAPDVLTRDELESIYIRMRNMEELEELRPYLYAMRYFGWGTKAEPEAVLSELKGCDPAEQPILSGLYQDLVLSTGKGTEQNKKLLEEARKKGYTKVYLKKKSALAVPEKKLPEKPKDLPKPAAPKEPKKLKITRVVLFQSNRDKPRAEDMNRYSTAFYAKNLDALYTKVIFQAPGVEMKLPYRLNIVNLNNNSVFHNGTGTATIRPTSDNYWVSVWVTKGQWPVARYQLTLELGEYRQQIQFTVS